MSPFPSDPEREKELLGPVHSEYPEFKVPAIFFILELLLEVSVNNQSYLHELLGSNTARKKFNPWINELDTIWSRLIFYTLYSTSFILQVIFYKLYSISYILQVIVYKLYSAIYILQVISCKLYKKVLFNNLYSRKWYSTSYNL